MKFTDGYWMVPKDVHPNHPRHVYEIDHTDRELTVYAPTREVRHRGDTLNQTLITTQYSSPMEGVIRVRIAHFLGGADRGPHFPVQSSDNDPVQVLDDEEDATLRAGSVAVHVRKGVGWSVRFSGDGETLTESMEKSVGYITTDAGERYIHEELNLTIGTHVFGLGERFGPLVKNGQVVDIWNQDGGTSSEQAYKNVPFFLTDSGYGVFVNHPGRVAFEIGSEKVSRIQFSVPGETMEYFFIYGPSPKAILHRYSALTGRPALPPKWSFGLWLSTSFTTDYDERTVKSFIDGMDRRQIPVGVFHFDTFWMHDFSWCDFEWDDAVFPDPAGMVRRLKERGLRLCLWINPYIAQRSKAFEEAKRNGFLLRKANGDTWQIDLWQPGMGVVDFTNPAACEWYRGKLRPLLEMGVDAFKTDFGERIPTEVEYFDGSSPERMHNYYAYLYNETVFDLLEEYHGKGGAVVFARSATAGCQRFPVHWGGDCESTFESMAESLRGGLSLGMSGFGFWSHDIGGFEGTPAAAVYKRWVAFGLLSSHSRLHGSTSYRVPWLIDEESVTVLHKFTKLKHRLMPYVYRASVEASTDGIPVMRAMVLEFPDDPAAVVAEHQYMLGPDMLVAPVLSPSGKVTFYLPAGRWTNFFTNEVVTGGSWRTETHGFETLPLYVRENAVIPVGVRDDTAEYDYRDGVVLTIYTPIPGARSTVLVYDDGASAPDEFEVTVTNERTQVSRSTGRTSWAVVVVPGDASDAIHARAGESDDLVEIPTRSQV